jgi:Mrp family chromosome partitioning ATPase
MDQIRKAVERAKGPLAANVQWSENTHAPRVQFRSDAGSALAPAKTVTINSAHLETNRIIAHDITDPRSRSFDMLRTQVLQSMDMKSWQFLGATSATEGCGKSVVSGNLALSIARQPERSVLLVDMDLQRPHIASNLGISCDRGILSVLQGRTNLQDSLVQACIGNQELLVLPCETATLSSSEWMSSRAMRDLLRDIKRDFSGWTVIFDLPPLLASDDVISMLPQLDCILFIVGSGTTTAEEIKECNRHFESTEVVRVVLNKADDATATYYSYSRYAPKPARPTKPSSTQRPKLVSRLLKRVKEI